MATQGNIAIWNYSKLISKFPEAQDNIVLRKVVGGFVYENPFKQGEKVLVTYNGDNLYFPNGFYPDYTPEQWMQNFAESNLTEPEKHTAEKIIEYLLKDCCEADWLVWT